MLKLLFDPQHYPFWLLTLSLLVLLLERLRPWRRQRLWRPKFGQDLFWLIFNGHFAGLGIAYATVLLTEPVRPAFASLQELGLVAQQALWVQFTTCLLLKDLVEWGIHNLLHRVPWLWEFHKLHHSIEQLDWIGNFRFHWMEIVVYRSLSYLPLVVLGVEGRIFLWIAVLTTLIGHLNHSNLSLTWGPFRYVLNSPRMHVWHHDRDWPAAHPRGVNFAIVFSLWDWLFRTAWWPSVSEAPAQQPARLGFPGMERFPNGLLARLVYPIASRRATR